MESQEHNGEVTVYQLLLVLMKRRYLIGGAALTGLLIGATPALLKAPQYSASFLVIPAPGDQSGGSQLGGLASTLGIRGLGDRGMGATSSPSFLARASRSRVVLDEVALDSIRVPEMGGQHVLILDLFASADTEQVASQIALERRLVEGTRMLSKRIRTSEIKDISGFTVSVTTRWPAVSYAIANAMLRELQEINMRIGQQGAAAERQFLQTRMAEQATKLREAQDRQARFLRANREFRNNPELSFEFERLRTSAELHQQVLLQLTQSNEQAQLREKRDTPVLAVVERPKLPVEREPRGTILWGLLGLVFGVAFGVLVSLARWGMARDASRDPDAERLVELIRSPLRRTPRVS